MLPLILTLLLAGGPAAGRRAGIPDLRLYDSTPVSSANPVLLRAANGAIEISLAELRAYVAAEPATDAKKGPLTPAQKREYLHRLLDEHLLLWDGYRRGADRSPDIVRMLEQTRNMLLAEAVQQETARGRAQQDPRAPARLRDRLFDAMEIHVSQEAYEWVTRMSQRLTPEQRTRSLAKCRLGTITIGDFRDAYVRLPPEARPDLRRKDAFIAVLKQLLGDALLVDEAKRRGLERSDAVRQALQMNRNVLTRLWVLDRLTETATARVNQPGIETRVRQWYDAQREARYVYKDERGRRAVVSFEAERESIRNDYFEALVERLRADAVRSLRAGQVVEIDEAHLGRAVVTWP